MKYSDGKYSVTLTDSNKILDEFTFKTTNGITATKSGNKLTLTSTSAVNDAVILTLKVDAGCGQNCACSVW